MEVERIIVLNQAYRKVFVGTVRRSSFVDMVPFLRFAFEESVLRMDFVGIDHYIVAVVGMVELDLFENLVGYWCFAELGLQLSNHK